MRAYSCDACGRSMPCCTYLVTPHGDGWFCHKCRHQDDPCEECAGVKWALRLRESKAPGFFMGPNRHWVTVDRALPFPSVDEALAYAKAAGYAAETIVEMLP